MSPNETHENDDSFEILYSYLEVLTSINMNYCNKILPFSHWKTFSFDLKKRSTLIFNLMFTDIIPEPTAQLRKEQWRHWHSIKRQYTYDIISGLYYWLFGKKAQKFFVWASFSSNWVIGLHILKETFTEHLCLNLLQRHVLSARWCFLTFRNQSKKFSA